MSTNPENPPVSIYPREKNMYFTKTFEQYLNNKQLYYIAPQKTTLLTIAKWT